MWLASGITCSPTAQDVPYPLPPATAVHPILTSPGHSFTFLPMLGCTDPNDLHYHFFTLWGQKVGLSD